MALPQCMWVPLGAHAQALILADPERITAVLYWEPPVLAEELGPGGPEPVVALGGYQLVAVDDPRDQLTIADEEDGASEPTSRDWPDDLLREAAEAYFEKWGGR